MQRDAAREETSEGQASSSDPFTTSGEASASNLSSFDAGASNAELSDGASSPSEGTSSSEVSTGSNEILDAGAECPVIPELGDAAPPVRPRVTVDLVQLYSYEPGKWWQPLVSRFEAFFSLTNAYPSRYVPPDGGCERVTSGTCTLWTCGSSTPESNTGDGDTYEPFTAYLKAPSITLWDLNPMPTQVQYGWAGLPASSYEGFGTGGVTWNGGRARIMARFGCGVPDLELPFELPPVAYPRFSHGVDRDSIYPSHFSWTPGPGEARVSISSDVGTGKRITCTAPAEDGALEVDISFLEELGERGSASITMDYWLEGSIDGWDYRVSAAVTSSASGYLE